MELLELASQLELEQRKIADEMIDIMRKDINYLESMAKLERKIALMLNGTGGSILIKNIHGKLEF